MNERKFTPRNELSDYEWVPEGRNWKRPKIDKAVFEKLSERSTLHGLLQLGVFLLFLAASAAVTVYAGRYSLWLAIPVLYIYYFFYGFWVALAHELQHKTVFAKSFGWFTEIVYFIVQALIWNSPRYARISHQLHHRYTMVRGVDPETNWPEVITSKWLRGYLRGIIANILIVGAVKSLFKDVMTQIRRALGQKDRMMREHCSDRDIAAIRVESLGILLFHLAVVLCAIWFRCWELILFITIAWQIGAAIEMLWHSTEHISRAYNVNDQRLCTRSVRVGPLVRLIYGGLDDHVDHHIFPLVPSRNLPKLHRILQHDLPEPLSMIECWREMFAVAREKDQRPESEYVPCELS